ncbi:MAG: deoxyribodipyrimidine photo-lyase, partial [Caldisericaceae bacterium]
RKGKYVLYWMQSSQRTSFNHALTFAIERANELYVPLVVLFIVKRNFQEENARHFLFLLQGLRDVWESLSKKGIRFVVKMEEPLDAVKEIAKNACLVVTDTGYLGADRQLNKSLAEQVDCEFVQIESDVVVPVEAVSAKEEYAAFTIRRKIEKQLPAFLRSFDEGQIRVRSSFVNFNILSFDVRDPEKALRSAKLFDEYVINSDRFRGGEQEAHIKLKDFIESKLEKYPTLRNDPLADVTSNLSPYLAFGHISPIEVALDVLKADKENKFAQQFIEELIVRRELAFNFVYYNKRYRSLDSVPEWAQRTLSKHAFDKRGYVYSSDDFENANTHDLVWNAAQKELVKTGKINGYIRMYWGKKILEWAENPSKAYKISLYLNNKYALDGNSPNSFAGIAWCFGKHDRPFKERPIFGMVRYMSKEALERHFDISKYIEKVNSLE